MKRLSLGLMLVLTIAGCASDPPIATRIIFHGDSLTLGVPGTPQDSYPSQVAAMRPFGLAWTNAGRGGATTAEMVAEAPRVVDPIGEETTDPDRPPIVVLYVGMNDLGSSTPEEIYAIISSYVRGRQEKGIRVIVGTLAKGGPLQFDEDRVALNALIVENDAGADGIADFAANERLDGSDDSLYADGNHIHLTEAGYGVMAEVVNDVLTEIGVPSDGSASTQLPLPRAAGSAPTAVP